MPSTRICCSTRSGEPEAAPLERPPLERSTLVLGQIVDARPADIPAAWTYLVGLPQRLRRRLSVTTAAEALDDE
jgi:hypothetical protein